MSLFRTLQSQARTITLFLTQTQALKLAPELRRIAITGGSDDGGDRVRINVSTSFPTRDQLKYISSVCSDGSTVLQRCIDNNVLAQLLRDSGDDDDRITVTTASSRLVGTPLSKVSSEIWKCGESSSSGSLWVDWEKGVVGDGLESLRKYVEGKGDISNCT